MTREIAELLRSMSNRRLVLLGVACVAVASVVIAALGPRGASPFMSLLVLLIATGVVSLGLALVRWARALGARNPARLRLLILAGVVVLAGAGFSTYSLGFYWKETFQICGTAHYADTIEERRAALAEGQLRLKSVFSILPELVGFRVSFDCALAARDLERLERGLCPYHMTTGTPCTCGQDRWPPSRECEDPQCVIGGSPERLRCFGDPW